MKTLSELNQRLENTAVRNWDTLTLRREYMVSTMNRTYQGYHSSGDKLHLALVETVIARSDEQKPNHVRVGDYFWVSPFCNGNGQRRGKPLKGRDTNSITCARCLKTLEKF